VAFMLKLTLASHFRVLTVYFPRAAAATQNPLQLASRCNPGGVLSPTGGARAKRTLPFYECRPPCRAAVLGVCICKFHAFVG
jgi:hypothetical protein